MNSVSNFINILNSLQGFLPKLILLCSIKIYTRNCFLALHCDFALWTWYHHSFGIDLSHSYNIHLFTTWTITFNTKDLNCMLVYLHFFDCSKVSSFRIASDSSIIISSMTTWTLLVAEIKRVWSRPGVIWNRLNPLLFHIFAPQKLRPCRCPSHSKYMFRFCLVGLPDSDFVGLLDAALLNLCIACAPTPTWLKIGVGADWFDTCKCGGNLLLKLKLYQCFSLYGYLLSKEILSFRVATYTL